MGYRKEYIENLTLSRSELYKIRRAQYEIRMQGFTYLDEGQLADNLVAFATVLSLAFILPTPVTLAAGVISAMGNIGSDRDLVIQVCRNGEDYLQGLIYYMDDHPEYDLLKVDLPFLEFIDEGFRIVQGNGAITAIHTGSGWILA
ncbi:MAG: hypothetical protein ACH0QD_08565 [Tepidibacillus sp.]